MAPQQRRRVSSSRDIVSSFIPIIFNNLFRIFVERIIYFYYFFFLFKSKHLHKIELIALYYVNARLVVK